MIPLSDQDPALWDRALIADANHHAAAAGQHGTPSARVIQAHLQRAWCQRRSLSDAPPWPGVLALYDALLALRDDAIVRLNRAVALAEVAGVAAALTEMERLDSEALQRFLPYHAVRADLLRRAGHRAEARDAYDAALALGPASAERRWLRRQRDSA